MQDVEERSVITAVFVPEATTLAKSNRVLNENNQNEHYVHITLDILHQNLQINSMRAMLWELIEETNFVKLVAIDKL